MAIKINFMLTILKSINIIMNQKVFRDKCQNLNTSINEKINTFCRCGFV